MVKLNELLESFVFEYGIEKDELFEYFAKACREKYGVVNIIGINEYSIFGLKFKDKFLVPNTIKLTQKGAEDICKKVVFYINEDIKNESNTSGLEARCSEILEQIKSEYLQVSDGAVDFKIISIRPLNKKEKSKPENRNIAWFIIVRASKYLQPAEKMYFKKRTSMLKPDIRFVLD